MTAEMGVSQSADSNLWRALGLKLHLVEQFRVSPDSQLIDKVHDMADLCLKPARRGDRTLR